MIIGDIFFKRDAVIHARVPSEVKEALQELAKEKDRTASEYLLELILKALHQEKKSLDPSVRKTQTSIDHDE